MKSLFTVAILMFSLVSQANTVQSVYQANSPLPQELKALILEKVTEECGHYFSDYGLVEISTEARPVKIDQLKDVYFTTVFSTAFVDNDGYHQQFSTIVVESADIEINNPTSARYNISSIKANGRQSCQ